MPWEILLLVTMPSDFQFKEPHCPGIPKCCAWYMYGYFLELPNALILAYKLNKR